MTSEVTKRVLKRVEICRRRERHARFTHFGLRSKKMNRDVADASCLAYLQSRRHVPSGEQKVCFDEMEQEIRRAIDAITADKAQRDQLVRRLIGEESAAVLAEEHGVSPSTIRCRVMRARRALRRMLSPKYPEIVEFLKRRGSAESEELR